MKDIFSWSFFEMSYIDSITLERSLINQAIVINNEKNQYFGKSLLNINKINILHV